MVFCTTCNKTLSASTHFCSGCGAPVIRNKAVAGKSTAIFDPLSRNFKPWRDAPLVQKRTYPELESKAVTIKVPWCPPMKSRQTRQPKSEIIYKPIESVVEEQVIEEVIPIEEPAPEPEIVVEVIDPLRLLCSEAVFPIVSYDASWISTIDLTVIHLSLVEQSISAGNKAYWLRISISLEDEELREDETSPEKMTTIAYLSNESAKLMVSDVGNWVDLPAISAKEYYMSQYLQRTLDVIAHRVSMTIPALSSINEQSYLIMARPVESVRTIEVSEYVDEYSEETPKYQEDKQQYQIVCFDQTLSDSKRSVRVTNEDSSADFIFDDSIECSAAKLKVFGQYRGASYFMCQVYLSITYLDRMGCREQIYDPVPPDSDDESESSSDKKNSKEGHRMSHVQFNATKKITNVCLHIIPRPVNSSIVVPSARLSFEVSSLRHLVSIESSPNSIQEAADAGVPLMSLFNMDQFIFNAIDGDRKLLPLMINKLMRIIRLEHDMKNDILKYMVIGTFAEPGINIPPRVKRVKKVKKAAAEKFVPIVRDYDTDSDEEKERKARRLARLKKQAEEEAAAEMEDISQNTSTPYRCPRHRIFACRCFKQEIILNYYKKQLPFTLFGEYFWHEELRYDQLKIEVSDSTVAIRQHAIQQYEHNNPEERGSPTTKKRNARLLQLMNKVPDGYEPRHLENLYQLVDYVALGYTIHFENHLTFVAVNNIAYNKAMADMMKDEITDREDYVYHLQVGYKQLTEVLNDYMRRMDWMSEEDLNMSIINDEIHVNAEEKVLAINFIKCKTLGNYFMFNAFRRRIELVFSRDHELMNLKMS